jgi:receptor protein-tyrosine kinase
MAPAAGHGDEMSALERVGPAHADRLIGAVLVHAGRLKPEDTQRILHLQHEQGMRFGEAAMKLGLISVADIDFALGLQFGYRGLVRGESKVSERLVAAYTASGPQVEELRALRGQLMQRWFDADPAHKALAVISTARNEGRSFIAASLAVVFSRLGQRTLLIDADMRHPSQHDLFGLDRRVGLSTLLAGRAGHEAIQQIPGLPELSVLPAGAAPPNPHELLAQPLFTRLLNELALAYDVTLVDTPSGAECTDGQVVAMRTGAALVVARRNFTSARHARDVCDATKQTGAVVVGTVLSDF